MIEFYRFILKYFAGGKRESGGVVRKIILCMSVEILFLGCEKTKLFDVYVLFFVLFLLFFFFAIQILFVFCLFAVL